METIQEHQRASYLHSLAAERGLWSDRMVIQIHKRLKGESLSLGFYVQPGTETLISMKVTRTTVPQESMRFYSPKERMCYTKEEFQPLYYNMVCRNNMNKIYLLKLQHKRDKHFEKEMKHSYFSQQDSPSAYQTVYTLASFMK